MSVYKTVDKGSWVLKNVGMHLKPARCQNPEVRNIKLGRQEHYRNSTFRSRFCEFYLLYFIFFLLSAVSVMDVKRR